MRRMFMFSFSLFASSAMAAELLVGPKATYPTIQAAVKAAKAGDVVTVSGGVYPEQLRVDTYYEGAPLTIRAAAGERAVVSGFREITDWKDLGGGLYSAHTEGRVRDLYVGLKQQQNGRWPEDGTLLPTEVDLDKRQFLTKPPADAPFLAEIAKDPHDAVVFYYFRFGNSFGAPTVSAYDAKTGVISFDERSWNRWLKPEGNLYSFMNHPALVRKPGNWAFVSDQKGDGKNPAGTVYFRPQHPEDLRRVRYRFASRPLLTIAHHKNRVGNVVIDGLEFAGGADAAIKAGGEEVTIQNCLIHNNGAHGISARGIRKLTVRSNVVLANANGVGLASVEGGLVEGNEIAYNLADGLVVAGNVSGRPGANPETTNVLVRCNYLHHHILQAHPDNFQMYRGVYDTTVVHNFNIWGGQSLMTEEVDGVRFGDNLFMGCGAIMVICGHGNSRNWKIRRNTFWGAGLGFFSFTDSNYEVKRNLFIGQDISYGEPDRAVEFLENFYAPTYFGRTSKPWRKLPTLADANALGYDRDSLVGTVKMANFPSDFGHGARNGNETGSVLIDRHTAADAFAVGDRIEINGDGKLRKVTKWDASSRVLAFEPALPAVPFRGTLVFNWKKSDSTVVDTTLVGDSKILTDGKPAYGASVDAKAFAAGDLLGKGRRTLPALPSEVAASIPDPNNVIVPPYGS